jgi:hypothetical protein
MKQTKPSSRTDRLGHGSWPSQPRQVLERDRRFGVTRRTDTPNLRVDIVVAAQMRDSWLAGRLLHAR